MDFFGQVNLDGSDVQVASAWVDDVHGRSHEQTSRLSDRELQEKTKIWYPDRRWTVDETKRRNKEQGSTSLSHLWNMITSSCLMFHMSKVMLFGGG